MLMIMLDMTITVRWLIASDQNTRLFQAGFVA